MVNFVKNCKTNEEKGHSCSHFYYMSTYRQIWYICMYVLGLQLLSWKVPFYLLIWLPRKTIYRVNFMWKMRKNVSHSPISTILIRESQILYTCVGLHLLSSKTLLYLTFGYCVCHGNYCMTLALSNTQILHYCKNNYWICLVFCLLLIIVVVTTSKLYNILAYITALIKRFGGGSQCDTWVGRKWKLISHVLLLGYYLSVPLLGLSLLKWWINLDQLLCSSVTF